MATAPTIFVDHPIGSFDFLHNSLPLPIPSPLSVGHTMQDRFELAMITAGWAQCAQQTGPAAAPTHQALWRRPRTNIAAQGPGDEQTQTASGQGVIPESPPETQITQSDHDGWRKELRTLKTDRRLTYAQRYLKQLELQILINQGDFSPDATYIATATLPRNYDLPRRDGSGQPAPSRQELAQAKTHSYEQQVRQFSAWLARQGLADKVQHNLIKSSGLLVIRSTFLDLQKILAAIEGGQLLPDRGTEIDWNLSRDLKAPPKPRG